MRVMIVVTHLLGTGHLSRARALADGFAAAGHETLLISGGRPAPHLAPAWARLEQLPSVASDGIDFARLLDDAGAPVTSTLMAARRAALLGHLAVFRPDALLTELFPFGRRTLADEFEALLDAARAARPSPVTISSVRDVLAPPSTAKKAAATEARLTQFYDAVLCHSDPSVVRLEESWPLSNHLRDRVRYTGFVTGPSSAADATAAGDGRGEILVSAGGGSVGAALFETSVAAARHDRAQDPAAPRWRLLVGGGDKTERIARLSARARDAGLSADAIIIEPVRPDFRALLARAAVSINQAGYNTLLDLAVARVPAVLVPFEEGGETEQAQRAAAFAARYGYETLREAALTPEPLSAAVARARLAGPPTAAPPDLNGVHETMAIVQALAEARDA